MKNRRNVVVYVAASLDGYIARENGDISWLDMVQTPKEDYGYSEFIKTIDTVIMGRKTYEKVLSFGIGFPHKDKKCYVLTRSAKPNDENVEFFSGDVGELISDLRQRDGLDIFLDGGAEAMHEFMVRKLIDRYVISIIPILLGGGIRLFREPDASSALRLIYSKAYPTGLVQLCYEPKT